MQRIMDFSVTFAGVNSNDVGAVAISQPIRQHPVLNGSPEDAVGRDGFLSKAKHYKYITCKQDFAIPNAEDIPEVLNWLRGSGDLIFSDEPDYAYEAMLLTVPSRQALAKHLDGQKLTVTWTCQPFRHEVREKQIILERSSVFCGRGHVNAFPLLCVEGSGTQSLIVNGRTFLLTLESGTPLYIDCDAKVVFIKLANGLLEFAGQRVTLTDAWPELRPKTKVASEYNNIAFTSGIRKLTITPRWRWC